MYWWINRPTIYSKLMLENLQYRNSGTFHKSDFFKFSFFSLFIFEFKFTSPRDTNTKVNTITGILYNRHKYLNDKT